MLFSFQNRYKEIGDELPRYRKFKFNFFMAFFK
jgi:hypothetical protein